jgi:[lysine-biosynthesis-protein LysW]---L-2-aminoadipate ligase
VKGNNKETSFFILYDQLRWEEKSLIETAKKKDIKLEVINCRENSIELDKDKSIYCNDIILQRCVSYYNNLHSTAAFEGLGAKMINSLHTAIMCGNIVKIWHSYTESILCLFQSVCHEYPK